MTQPPGSSGGGFGDPSPEEHQAPPPPQPGASPGGQAPPPGYNQPGQVPPPGQYWQPPPPLPYPGAPPQYWGPLQVGLSPQDERTWAMFAHIGAIIAGVLAMAFLGPLIVMLTQGTKSAFVRRHAVESLNFQLTLLIALVAGVLLSILTLGIGLLVFIPALIVGAIAALVFTIIAGITANKGEDYRYPINIRMVK